MATNDDVKTRRHAQVVNVAEAEPRPIEKGSRFRCQMKSLGPAAAGQAIGCSWYEVPPGSTAFPYHYHCANEESVYVLEGRGSLRIGADTVEVGPGDYVAFPPGPDSAHQLTNTGVGPLRYLCMSTMLTTEVVGYPDSGKFGAARWSDDPRKGPVLREMFRPVGLDYYDGESID